MTNNIHYLKSLKDLASISWDTNIIVTTVVYGNQDIHRKSVASLVKATSLKNKLSLILVDNKGDYDIDKLVSSTDIINILPTIDTSPWPPGQTTDEISFGIPSFSISYMLKP